MDLKFNRALGRTCSPDESKLKLKRKKYDY